METTPEEVRVLPIEQWCSDTRKQQAVLSEAARVLADAFAYIERLPNGFSNPSQCARSIKSGWKRTLVAVLDGWIVGVLVKSTPDENNICCVSLVGVSQKIMRKGIGRKLMNYVEEEARAEGKNSLRLTVNAHSTQSLPFYKSLGYEQKETLWLVSLPYDVDDPTFPPRDRSYYIRNLGADDIEPCCQLMQEICGFSRIEELKECVKYSRQSNFCLLKVAEDSTEELVGFTVGDWSATKTADQWKYLSHFMLARCGQETPEIFIPERYVELTEWSKQVGLRLYKKMHLMVKGEYADINGIYCPSAEY